MPVNSMWSIIDLAPFDEDIDENDLEKEAIGYYRSICRISMYPNVMNYLNYLKKDKVKMLRILERIIEE